MKLFNLKSFAVCIAMVTACGVLAVTALAATTPTKPKLTHTYVYQAQKDLLVSVYFKVSKVDSTFAAKAKLCAEGVCKSETLTKGLPAAEAEAEEYTPSLVIKRDELHKQVKVKTTLTVGTKAYVYTSHAKDLKSPCRIARSAPRSQASPRC